MTCRCTTATRLPLSSCASDRQICPGNLTCSANSGGCLLDTTASSSSGSRMPCSTGGKGHCFSNRRPDHTNYTNHPRLFERQVGQQGKGRWVSRGKAGASAGERQVGQQGKGRWVSRGKAGGSAGERQVGQQGRHGIVPQQAAALPPSPAARRLRRLFDQRGPQEQIACDV